MQIVIPALRLTVSKHENILKDAMKIISDVIKLTFNTLKNSEIYLHKILLGKVMIPF